MTMTVDLSYPVGRFDPQAPRTAETRRAAVEDIAALPARIREAVRGLTEAQLDTRYRPEGWTVRQLVHHVADSHLNSYVRFRLALTEHEPAVKPYDEALWAELPDARTLPVDVSLKLLESVHIRWVALLESLRPEDFARTLRHPELGTLDLNHLLA